MADADRQINIFTRTWTIKHGKRAHKSLAEATQPTVIKS